MQPRKRRTVRNSRYVDKGDPVPYDPAKGHKHKNVSRKRAQAEHYAMKYPHRCIQRKKPNGEALAPWVAPSHYPDWIVYLIRRGKMCGAELKNNGICTRFPIAHQSSLGRHAPFRCNYHGGLAPAHGENKKKNITIVDGIYSSAVLPGEETLFEEITKGGTSLDQEIAITRLRLQRAIRLEAEQELAMREGNLEDSLTLVSETVTERTEDWETITERDKEFKLIDYSKPINLIMGQICRLMNQKFIQEGDDKMSIEDKATAARELMRDMRITIGVAPSPEKEDVIAQRMTNTAKGHKRSY